MTYDQPPLLVPASPADVLEVFRDAYRQYGQFSTGGGPGFELNFETRISDWRDAMDLQGWLELSRVLDDEWKLGRNDGEWRAVLEPARKRTLGDLCQFIAGSGAMRPTIEPVTILGSTSLSAGAFLAIRSILRDAGADVDSLAPSTSLEPYTRRYLHVFLGPISRLAPNALPEVEIDAFAANILGVLGCLLGGGLLIGGEFLSTGSTYVAFIMSVVAMSVGFLLVVGSVVGTWLMVRRGTLKPAKFGSLRTFRAMARVIAEGTQRSGPFSTES